MLRFLLFIAIVLPTFSTYAAARSVLAVVDSWFDKDLPLFSGRVFVNTKEKMNGIDDDGNGYVDDISGWNFYHHNNHLFEYEKDKQFSYDLYKFYELRAQRKIRGLSESEEAWVKETYANEDFKNEVYIFRRYSHGTHVGSIALLGDILNPLFPDIPSRFKILPIKLYGSRVDWDNVEDDDEDQQSHPGDDGISDQEKIKRIKKKLVAEAKSTGKRSREAFSYLGKYAQVANCSYGNSQSSLENTVKRYFGRYYARKIKAKELKELLDYYATQMELQIRSAVRLAPHTLFIFSAGNSGDDNDQYYHFPSNVKEDNTLTVASTFRNERIGGQSNYGFHSVEIAAPGIAVSGVIPNGKVVKMSGTSQAAPYVAHLAIRIAEFYKINGVELTPKQLKMKILQVVDKKDFLSGKVSSEGVPSLSKIAKIFY